MMSTQKTNEQKTNESTGQHVDPINDAGLQERNNPATPSNPGNLNGPSSAGKRQSFLNRAFSKQNKDTAKRFFSKELPLCGPFSTDR